MVVKEKAVKQKVVKQKVKKKVKQKVKQKVVKEQDVNAITKRLKKVAKNIAYAEKNLENLENLEDLKNNFISIF